MARPGIEVAGSDVRWTSEELAEAYAELKEIEPLVEGPAIDETPREGDELEGVAALELVAALEARRDEGAVPRESGAAWQARSGAETEPESYAVAPELELLEALAEYGCAEAARDDVGDKSREALPLVA